MTNETKTTHTNYWVSQLPGGRYVIRTHATEKQNGVWRDVAVIVGNQGQSSREEQLADATRFAASGDLLSLCEGLLADVDEGKATILPLLRDAIGAAITKAESGTS